MNGVLFGMRPITMTAAGLAVLASAACYTTKVVSFGDFGTDRVARVWVTRADQSVVLVKNAEVSGTKLRGFVEREYQELDAADLREIKVRKLAGGRTAALVVGGAAAFIGVAVIVSGTEDTFDPCVGIRPDCMLP